MTISHAGLETVIGERHQIQHLTACGKRLRPSRAPLKQPVHNITCLSCRRIIAASMRRFAKERWA